jgi:hypothetical protein
MAAPKAMARLKGIDERDSNTIFSECGNKTMKPIPAGFFCFQLRFFFLLAFLEQQYKKGLCLSL